MPPHQKPMGRLAKSASQKNSVLVSACINGKETIFARIEANLGPQFRIVVFDHSKNRVIQAFGISRKAKKHLPIEINDLVLLSALPKDGEVGEIVGRIGRKEARPLFNEGRIHSTVFTPADLFGVVNEPLNDIFEDEVDIENI
jgi:hypothetical protein